MAGVVVRQRLQEARRDYRMFVRSADGTTILGVPYAPRGVDLSGIARTWAEIARPAAQPFLTESGEPLARLEFELVLGNPENQSIEDLLSALREVAASDERLIVSYGPSEGGYWRLVEMSQTSELRDANDHISRATARLVFLEVSDFDVNLSPLGGGHNSGGKKRIPATHKVKKGDTLHKIAVEYYGDPKWWRAIADENKIKQPRKDEKLKPGRVLDLPRRGDEKKKKGKGGK